MTRFASLLFLGLLASCAAPDKSPAPIKVGAVLPFSGGVELYGQQARIGLDLAVKEINATGGILGRPVEILYRNNNTRAPLTVEVTRRLIEHDHVLAIFGPITSQNLNAIKPEIERGRTPLLYATNYEGGACSRYIFAFSTVPNQELTDLLPYMNETFGKTYYLLGANHAWPQKMFAVAAPLIAKLGGRVVGEEFTTGKETDFTPLIDRIAATKARVLLFALKGDGMNFIVQAHDRGLFKHMAVAFLGLSETDMPVFHGKGRNMYVVVPFVASSPAPAVRKFVARARAEAGAGVPISNYVMTHYNAVMAMKAALEKAGKVDKESLMKGLEGLTIDSPAGPVTIGKNHHATRNLFLARSDGTGLVTVRALGPIAPDPGCP